MRLLFYHKSFEGSPSSEGSPLLSFPAGSEVVRLKPKILAASLPVFKASLMIGQQLITLKKQRTPLARVTHVVSRL